MNENGGGRVDIQIGDINVHSQWNDTKTARKILDALPIQATGNYWGGEIYFPIPVKTAGEPDAQEVVEPGTVAYWPQGACLCIFWGPTPASEASECRAASAVSIVGRVLNPEVLPKLKSANVKVDTAG